MLPRIFPCGPGSGEREREVRLHSVSAQVADVDAERAVALASPRERELLGCDRRGDGDRAGVAREADVVDADVDAPCLDSAAGAAVAAAQASTRVAVGEGLARVEADRASDVPRPAAAGERAVAEREGRAAEREEERRERDDEGRRGLPGHLLLLVETAHLRPAQPPRAERRSLGSCGRSSLWRSPSLSWAARSTRGTRSRDPARHGTTASRSRSTAWRRRSPAGATSRSAAARPPTRRSSG